MRLPSFPGSSDDDDGHPNTGILQSTPLGVVLKVDRYERHPIGEYDICPLTSVFLIRIHAVLTTSK